MSKTSTECSKIFWQYMGREITKEVFRDKVRQIEDRLNCQIPLLIETPTGRQK